MHEAANVAIDDLVLVSVDDHVVEPPGLFDAHVPEQVEAAELAEVVAALARRREV